MSKTLFVYESESSVSVSTTREQFKQVPSKWQIVSEFKQLRSLGPHDIDEHDVVILIRPEDILSLAIARKARESGAFVITFCDDDLLNLPKDNIRAPWRKSMLKKALCSSDALMTSSPHIAEKYAPLTLQKRSFIMDTIVKPEEICELKVHDNDKVRIVYAAAVSHAEMFNRLVVPALEKLADQYGDKFSLHFVSVRPDVSSIQNKVDVTWHPAMPLVEFRQFMMENQFEIGLAPGIDEEFFKCKYYNKFIEYSCQGTVGVYSNVEPYTYVARDGENGYLADNTPEGWYTAIERALLDADGRAKCLENAVRYIRENHNPEVLFGRYVEALPELQQYDMERSPCNGFEGSRILYRLLRIVEVVWLTFATLKKKGMKTVIAKIKKHFPV